MVDMQGTPVSIVPSVLPADFARLGEEVQALEEAGADRIQWDVMDGRFVPNLTFGPDVIAAVRPLVGLPFEAHLMVAEPDVLLPKWIEAGCETVIVHAEACTHLHRTLGRIAELGARAGVALNPATPLEAVTHVLDMVDLLLVMTVNPGFGGQAYLSSMEPKIRQAAHLLAAGDKVVELEVDGGISTATVAGPARAGARSLVAGSALYRDPHGLEHAVKDLRTCAEEACLW
ncbi:MAG TPA: ribulose-phosphate 3-epimerase [Acidimicrobiia bacterium]|nr:ribulose-phosphate 3-epimerase [Acidimicrobiia bacterium]